MFSGTDVPPRAFRFEHSPIPDQIDPNRRLEPNAPVVEAYLGGRHVFLARPEQRGMHPGEGADFTLPLTVSRMRRASDIERGLAPGPYMPSLVEYAPLGQPIVMVEETDEDRTRRRNTQIQIWIGFAVAGAIGGGAALGAWKGRAGVVPGLVAGTVGGLMGAAWMKAMST